MKPVQRYDMKGNGGMIEISDGSWVDAYEHVRYVHSLREQWIVRVFFLVLLFLGAEALIV